MKQKNRLISITLATLLLVSLCAVCASASVSAADTGSSRASVNAPSGLAGSHPVPAGTGPSACVLNAKYQFLFVKGYDGALWYKKEDLAYSDSPAQNWGWESWKSLGGQLGGSPVALSRSPNIITVYVAGTNGAIYAKSTADSGSTWHGWYWIDRTAKAGTGPASAGSSNGREDVFWVDAYGNLWQKAWTSAHGWWTKINLGKPSTGGLTSSPAAISMPTGQIEVHARGANGADYYRSYYNGAWHAWATLGGTLKPGTGPGLIVKRYWAGERLVDREDIFITGTDGAMYQKTAKTGVGWTPTWTYLGGQLTSSPTVTIWGFGLKIWARFTDGNMYLKEYGIGDGIWFPSKTTWSAGIPGP